MFEKVFETKKDEVWYSARRSDAIPMKTVRLTRVPKWKTDLLHDEMFFNEIKKKFMKSLADSGQMDGLFSKAAVKAALQYGAVPREYSVHHIHPHAMGGDNRRSNLCLIHNGIHDSLHSQYLLPLSKRIYRNADLNKEIYVEIPDLPPIVHVKKVRGILGPQKNPIQVTQRAYLAALENEQNGFFKRVLLSEKGIAEKEKTILGNKQRRVDMVRYKFGEYVSPVPESTAEAPSTLLPVKINASDLFIKGLTEHIARNIYKLSR